jgi:hypothetical protein
MIDTDAEDAEMLAWLQDVGLPVDVEEIFRQLANDRSDCPEDSQSRLRAMPGKLRKWPEGLGRELEIVDSESARRHARAPERPQIRSGWWRR